MKQELQQQSHFLFVFEALFGCAASNKCKNVFLIIVLLFNLYSSRVLCNSVLLAFLGDSLLLLFAGIGVPSWQTLGDR